MSSSQTPDSAAASLAPGADEVSANVAELFDSYARVYQAIRNQFTQLPNAGADGATGVTSQGLHI